MSGLLALLDDVAAIAKLAAAQIDDVALQAAKAGSKAAGVVIDDAAVTPKYVADLPAARELPIVWKIARASLFNKLVILLPAALLLNALAPWVITPLLMLGGGYLCYEGAEKVWRFFAPHEKSGAEKAETLDAAHLEEQRVSGAIKTDFVLSAEVMAISLAAIETDAAWMLAVVLAIVAIGITAVVYGAVALLVKADDLGLAMAQRGRLDATRAAGRAIVRGMPPVMTVISGVGAVAMLWVGGSILSHGLHDLGWHAVYDSVKSASTTVADAAGGFAGWMTMAGLDGALGLLIGLVLFVAIGAGLRAMGREAH